MGKSILEELTASVIRIQECYDKSSIERLREKSACIRECSMHRLYGI
jgi:hypothetical protein